MKVLNSWLFHLQQIPHLVIAVPGGLVERVLDRGEPVVQVVAVGCGLPLAVGGGYAVDKKTLAGNIEKVVQAPPGYTVSLVAPPGTPGAPQGIRVVDDPNAPIAARVNAEDLYPFRLKEVTESVSARLNISLRPYDVLCSAEVHGTRNNPNDYYKFPYSSPTYSHALVDWLVRSYPTDSSFFAKAIATWNVKAVR